MSKVIVPASGPTPNDVMIVGEAPGKVEAQMGRPFAGPSGVELNWYFDKVQKGRPALAANPLVLPARTRMTNVVPEYIEGNPDPTTALIRQYEPLLLDELARTQPRVVVAVGRAAARWFLGNEVYMQAVHGLPHRVGEFDPARKLAIALQGCHPVVVPAYHPAMGLYNGDVKAVLMRDYERVVDTIVKVRAGKPVDIRHDEHAGREHYLDLTGRQLAVELARWRARPPVLDHRYGTPLPVIALDTEGSPAAPWALQITTAPGTSWVLRRSQPDFEIGARALNRALTAGAGSLVVLHCASTPTGTMYDVQMCRAMGVELSHPRVRWFDTMMGAYLLRLEPKGLKPLAWRWCAMKMQGYRDVLGRAGEAKQLDYLERVMQREWPKPSPQLSWKNDGTSKLTTPWHIHRRVEKILLDYHTAEPPDDESDDETESPTTELARRWRMIDDVQRELVEGELGAFPHATLDDVELPRALAYSARDSDATMRLYQQLLVEHTRLDLTHTMLDSMAAFVPFERMQATGIPASRRAFVELHDKLDRDLDVLGQRISTRYFGGKPFNPKSTDKVGAVMRRRGLDSAKRTPKGKMSTGKAAIEHLRDDPAINDIQMWREMQHVRDTYCKKMLGLMPPTSERNIALVHCALNPTGTTSRRLAAKNPNLLGFPKHEKPGENEDDKRDYGKLLRSCFVAPEGHTFLEVDLSQVEVRLLAHESADALLMDAYINPRAADGSKRDIHRETAAKIFGIRKEDVSEHQRFFAKRTVFGTAYGVTGAGLAAQLRIAGITDFDDQACDKFIREWLRVHKGCADYFAAVERDVVAKGWVRDMWGHYRYLPAVWSNDHKLAAEARRQAVNHRIQAGAQGLLQRSMAWLWPRVNDLSALSERVKVEGSMAHGVDSAHYPAVQWCLSIHDSLLYLARLDVVDRLSALVVEGLSEHHGAELRVPLGADAKVGATWGELG